MPIRNASVDAYLAALPEDRREALSAIRKVILANLDSEYEEGIQYGMIGYYVPHRVFPAGYHCNPKEPLPFAGLASQKNHMSLYLGCVGSDGEADCDTPSAESSWFRSAWEKAGKTLDMGKSCVRFKRLDQVPLEVVGEAIRRWPAERYVSCYQAARGRTEQKPAAKKPAAAKATPKAVGARKAPPNKTIAKNAARKVVKKTARKA